MIEIPDGDVRVTPWPTSDPAVAVGALAKVATRDEAVSPAEAERHIARYELARASVYVGEIQRTHVSQAILVFRVLRARRLEAAPLERLQPRVHVLVPGRPGPGIAVRARRELVG